MRRLLVMVGALTAASSLLSPIVAGAEDLHCGSVVTHDVVLTHDLASCDGDGLVIGADGVTVDLAGFAILGRFPGEEGTGTVGIRIRGHDHVTIEGGGLWGSRVEGFDSAIELSRRADDNRILRLNLRGGSYGVALHNSDRNHIEGNSVAFAGGEFPEPCVAGAEAGIALFRSQDNLVRGNKAELGLFGIMLVGSHGNLVEDNEAAPESSDGNVCEGVALYRSHRNQVVGNTVAHNVSNGILVSSRSRDNIVEANFVLNNADDGIDVDDHSTTVKDNESDYNANMGIDAVEGVVDGGGNRAEGNLNPIQCRNVVCS